MSNSLKEKEIISEIKNSKKERKDMTKGQLLKQVREERGLSLDSVHEATKVPLDALKAIEEGYTIRTLSEFYYKGFLKIYATYLNVDVSEVIDDYKQEEPQKIIVRKEKPPASFEWKKWVAKNLTKERKQQLVVIAGIFLFLIVLFKSITFLIHVVGQHRERVKEKKKIVAVEQVVEKKIPVQKVVKKTEKPVEVKKTEKKTEKVIEKANNVEKKTEVSVSQQTVVQQPKEVVPPKPKVLVPIPVEAIQKQTGETAEAPVTQNEPSAVKPQEVKVVKNLTLTVRAKKSSWLRVLADNQTVFQATLRRGAVETWLADNSIEISGRNIDQLEFELNGKMIGSLGRADRKAKKIVVTKEGLSVSK
ncbi:MAG: DUF4115 domain-containing protein [Candidatus Omnitrophica bacterium]|nr:DUF4115 domain-containing protein [Candidatus Omnitrophota bacterium]MCB9747769.1 DUF4115 domain-containing protein [Candidatus Omnitrophota bacterium]